MSASEPILTLEPMIEAVRDGVEGAGWTLSGLQKTTSHEYAGRWEGESSRSAYLFFHREGGHDAVSVDVFLDETSRGMQGNLALVFDAPTLDGLGDPADALSAVAGACGGVLPGAYRTPISLRLRLNDAGVEVGRATVEFRVKLRIPEGALRSGFAAVSALATTAVRAFEKLLEHPDVVGHAALD